MSARCAICGNESPSLKGFQRQPVGRARYRLVCPLCSIRQADAAFRSLVIALLIATVVGAVLIRNQPPTSIGYLLWYVGSFCWAYMLSVLPHELGHALAAVAVGMRLFNVTIGRFGRILSVRRVFGYDVAFRSIPLGGFTICTPKRIRFARLRFFIVTLCGPLANVLLIVAAQAIFVRLSSRGAVYYAVAAVIHSNIALLALNLLPRKVWVQGKLSPNDGLQLVSIPFLSSEKIRAQYSATVYLELLEALEREKNHDAEQWLAKGEEVCPQDWWVPYGRAKVLERQRRYEEARDACLMALNHPKTTPDVQPQLWNDVARLDVTIGAPALYDEARQFSSQAFEAFPWLPAVRGTRGAVLVEIGQLDEGSLLLEQALREEDGAPHKAVVACYLAIALAKQGNTSQARAYIEEAKKSDPGTPLLERAAAELERGERGAVLT